MKRKRKRRSLAEQRAKQKEQKQLRLAKEEPVTRATQLRGQRGYSREVRQNLQRESIRLSPEYHAAMSSLRSRFSEFEDLAVDANVNGNSEMIALLDILIGAGLYDGDFWKQYTTALETSFADYQKDQVRLLSAYGEAGFNHASAMHAKMINLEYRKLTQSRPLMRIIMDEMWLNRHLLDLRRRFNAGENTTALRSSLRKDMPSDKPHRALISALEFDSRVGKSIQMDDSEQDAIKQESDEIHELVRDSEFDDAAWKESRPYPLQYKGNPIGTVRLFSKKNQHPFSLCSYDIHDMNGKRVFYGSVSRISGDLVFPDSLLPSIQVGLPNTGLYQVIRNTVLNAVIKDVEHGFLKQMGIAELPEEPVQKSEVAQQETALEGPEHRVKVEQPEYKYIPEPMAAAVVTQEHAPVRVTLPSMTHMQFARTLRRAKVKIVSGGKHLAAQINGKSTTFYNSHGGERRFHSSEIMEVLEALDIYDEFIEKLPRRLFSTVRQRLGKKIGTKKDL